MTLVRRLAQIERRRLDRAVADFRRTLEAYDRRQARRRLDPEHVARVEAQHEAFRASLPLEVQREHEEKSERMLEAMRLLGQQGATEEDVDRAVRLLAPIVTPPDSPPYARVGALRRAVAEWLTHEDE